MNLSRPFIAYKVKDSENESWTEDVYLFQNRMDVKHFFNPNNKTFLSKFTRSNNREVRNFEIEYNDNASHVIEIRFETDYAGKIVVEPISLGYMVETKFSILSNEN